MYRGEFMLLDYLYKRRIVRGTSFCNTRLNSFAISIWDLIEIGGEKTFIENYVYTYVKLCLSWKVEGDVLEIIIN